MILLCFFVQAVMVRVQKYKQALGSDRARGQGFCFYYDVHAMITNLREFSLTGFAGGL